VIRVIRFDQFEHASLTDVGVRRSHNQDNHAIQLARDEEQWLQRGHLFLVADGMGAHAVGEKASEQAAAIIPHTYQKHAPQGPVTALRKAFAEANASIHAYGQQNSEFKGTGTTSTALLLRQEGAWIGHVGDSRAYRIRDGVIEQLSYDHSLLWEYARINRLDPSEVQGVPANVIHRCLGPEPLVQVDIEGPHPLLPGDIFLLCSDGLSGQVTDREIGAIVSVLPAAEACRFLVDLANLRGGPDNTTVIIVRVHGSPDANGLAPPSPPRRLSRLARLPWWIPALAGGSLLVIGALYLEAEGHSALGVLAFLLATAAFVIGVVGLVQQYQRERKPHPDDELPGPRIHRHATCRVELPLIERLAGPLKALRQHAGEKHWDVDWALIDEHQKEGEAALQRGELPTAFREYCRTMLPLLRVLQKMRHKEESFQPLWDRTQ
jgi:protein phosphatase